MNNLQLRCMKRARCQPYHFVKHTVVAKFGAFRTETYSEFVSVPNIESIGTALIQAEAKSNYSRYC